MRVYPLSQANAPPEMDFISLSGQSFNAVYPNNFQFYGELNAVVQSEPIDFFPKGTRGLWAPIGIAKGRAFAPDERKRAILKDAVAIGNATARSIVWHPRKTWNMGGLQSFDGLNWNTAFLNANVFFDGPDGETMVTDARMTFHYPYTVVTPAMAKPRADTGSDYRIAFLDAEDQPFDGLGVYRVTLPPNPPVEDFWAFTLYESQTRSMLQTDQALPTVDSIQNDPVVNADGSIDVYFAPEAPDGMDQTWVQTIPGNSFFVILRMYGLRQEWLNRNYVPGEVTRIDRTACAVALLRTLSKQRRGPHAIRDGRISPHLITESFEIRLKMFVDDGDAGGVQIFIARALVARRFIRIRQRHRPTDQGLDLMPACLNVFQRNHKIDHDLAGFVTDPVQARRDHTGVVVKLGCLVAV
ncbi:MAG: DUF1254 domain-containing protein [Rhodobacteraceae bacterium]|nr:DUF1254 domain-containing protein [Paracoccaceae bacterium]